MKSPRMRAHSFSHVGITVRDFNRSVRWYADVFGCPVIGVTEHEGPDVNRAFRLNHERPYAKIGWLRAPGGGIIEIFEFAETLDATDVVWNRQGPTHFSLNVKDTAAWQEHLEDLGVEIYRPREQSPRGHTFLFVADPDGNLIELIDNGKFRWIIKYLGPLGGWLFRRTMYKKYYR